MFSAQAFSVCAADCHQASRHSALPVFRRQDTTAGCRLDIVVLSGPSARGVEETRKPVHAYGTGRSTRAACILKLQSPLAPVVEA